MVGPGWPKLAMANRRWAGEGAVELAKIDGPWSARSWLEVAGRGRLKASWGEGGRTAVANGRAVDLDGVPDLALLDLCLVHAIAPLYQTQTPHSVPWHMGTRAASFLR